MSLQKQIEQDFTQAFKGGEKVVVAVLRMLKTAVQNKQIEKKLDKGSDLSDEEVIAVIKSELKKRQDSIVSYKEGGREELAKIEEAEAKVLEKYLPEQMSEEAVKEIVKQVAEEMGATSQADFGKVMGAVMSKVNGQANGQVVSGAVKEILS